ncbi:glycosyl transferase family 2 [Fulvimarina sp. MAC8]|uniref:glycosyl transferase family 2 n=1 Tax=Fulvimarina sp. MAC8 TaxID=3162874 RepID=UPI0032EADE3C
MLTIYMDCGSNDRHLALTLSELISGSIEGVVKNVVLIDRGMTDDTRSVADQCGCRVIAPDDLETTIKQDRAEWLLWLEKGSRPTTGWTNEIIEHIGNGNGPSGGPQAARFRTAKRDRAGFLSRLTQRRSALADGLLLKKAQAIGLIKQRGEAPLSELAKGLAAKRLDTELRPATAAG